MRARGRPRGDFALTAVLLTGNHITFADHVLADGNLETSIVKRSIHGFSIVGSIGGTYGFDEEEAAK